MTRTMSLGALVVVATAALTGCGDDGATAAADLATTPSADDADASTSGGGSDDGAVACSDYAPDEGPSPAGARVVLVHSAAELAAAIAAAAPGDAITLADGTYHFDGNVDITRPGTTAQRIFMRAEHAGKATIEHCSTEGFRVSARDWIFEDLVIKGACPDDTNNEHAFHITGAAHETILRHNRVVDFKSHVKLNLDDTTSRIWPDDTWYIGNVFMDTAPQPGAQPFNALNLDGGRRHVIRGNLFVDLVAAADHRASAIYPKITTRDMIVEDNLVVCTKHVTGGFDRAGLSTGEAWNPNPYCDGDCANVGNIYRNNIVLGCNGPGNSFGIGVGYEKATSYLHNSVHGAKHNYFDGNANSSGADVAMVSNILFADWLFDGPGRPTETHDLLTGAADVFVDAAHGNFALKDGTAIRGRAPRDARAPHDFCGHCRAAMTDIGAIDYSDPRAADCVAKIQSLYDSL